MKINAWMPQMFTIKLERTLSGAIGDKEIAKDIQEHYFIRDVAGNGVVPGYQASLIQA